MSDIVVAETQQELEELELIRTRFGIDKERFAKAVEFAQLIVEGVSRKRAYEQAFDVDKQTAISRASSTFRAKYVQELVRYFRPNDDTLYIGEVKTIIQRGMEIVRDRRSSPREVTEAMKALQPYIKQQIESKVQVEHTHEVKPADAVMVKMQKQIESLTGQGKMVDQSGDIIDVEYVK